MKKSTSKITVAISFLLMSVCMFAISKQSYAEQVTTMVTTCSGDSHSQCFKDAQAMNKQQLVQLNKTLNAKPKSDITAKTAISQSDGQDLSAFL